MTTYEGGEGFAIADHVRNVNELSGQTELTYPRPLIYVSDELLEEIAEMLVPQVRFRDRRMSAKNLYLGRVTLVVEG
jgi:hypothetical protein